VAEHLLKRASAQVETPEVKTCPHCDGEIRDSVIRCTHCGRNLHEEDEGREPAKAGTASGALSARPAHTSPAVSARPAHPSPPVATRPRTGPEPDVWAEVPAAPPVSRLGDASAYRALPATTRRSWGPDIWMLWAGMATIAAGVLAYEAVKQPWVHLTVTRPETEFAKAEIVQLSLRGQAAFVGVAGQTLAITIAVFGLIWFFYGFQRGWSMPGLVNPLLGIVVSSIGIAMTALSSVVWFVWEHAMILRAGAGGITASEMQELLDQQPPPHVQIERLSGLMSFGGMMVLGLFAASLGWWAYRRRS
jgi:hypothetical protein